VTRVGEQRERVREEAADDFGDQKCGGERERDLQAAKLSRVSRTWSVMVVTMRVLMAVVPM